MFSIKCFWEFKQYHLKIKTKFNYIFRKTSFSHHCFNYPTLVTETKPQLFDELVSTNTFVSGQWKGYWPKVYTLNPWLVTLVFYKVSSVVTDSVKLIWFLVGISTFSRVFIILLLLSYQEHYCWKDKYPLGRVSNFSFCHK